jgi:zinc-ribbon domain
VRCEVCGTENPEGAAFCDNCGADVPRTGVAAAAAGAAPSTSSRSSDAGGMPAICPHFGANGCTSNSSCELCGGVVAGGGALPAPVDDVHWVQLRLEVQCVFCRTRSPVGHLDEGRFFCFSCARELPYLAGFWQERLEYASAGGDCFWSRFGRFPAWQWPKLGMADDELTALMRLLRDLGGGRQKIFAEGFSPHSLGEPISSKQKLTMAPGHPLCDSCHAPLTAQFGARGAVTMSCSGCGSHKSYQAPAVALAACEEVIAVVAPDHLQGAKSVGLQREPQSAAVAITCPSCGAALHLAPGERLTICSYCNTESIVPLGVMAQAIGSAPGEQPIWLALRSPAKLRHVYARAARAEAESARDVPPGAVRGREQGAESEEERVVAHPHHRACRWRACPRDRRPFASAFGEDQLQERLRLRATGSRRSLRG